MELNKIRNLGDHELSHEGGKAQEQLFRLRFQMKLGQNEGVKKLRELKKDIARIKTVERERQLGIHGEAPKADAVPAEKTAKAAKAAGKKTAKKSTAKPTKKAAAKKKSTKKEAR
jgi:large subunit ribosomal protein L29